MCLCGKLLFAFVLTANRSNSGINVGSKSLRVASLHLVAHVLGGGLQVPTWQRSAAEEGGAPEKGNGEREDE